MGGCLSLSECKSSSSPCPTPRTASLLHCFSILLFCGLCRHTTAFGSQRRTWSLARLVAPLSFTHMPGLDVCPVGTFKGLACKGYARRWGAAAGLIKGSSLPPSPPPSLSQTHEFLIPRPTSLPLPTSGVRRPVPPQVVQPSHSQQPCRRLPRRRCRYVWGSPFFCPAPEQS